MRFALIALLLCGAVYLSSQQAPRPEPGPLQGGGGFLLNSGWRVTPVGRQVKLGTLPMSSALSPDGKYLLILNGGYMPPNVAVLDAASMQEVSTTGPLADAWLGLTFSPDGKFVYVGGGATSTVYEFSFAAGQMKETRRFEITPEAKRTHLDFIGDVALSPDGRLIYVAGLFRDVIHVINPQSGRVIEHFSTGRRPYRILFHPDGRSLFVSSWADGAVYQHRPDKGERINVVRLGSHTTDMVWRPKKADANEEPDNPYSGHLFVAAANTNNVYAVGFTDNRDLRMVESINLGMTPRHPLGMTPSALAWNADMTRLFVVCSDANAVAVVDTSDERSRVLGFVPTGWYPTGVRSLPDHRLIVLNGRGLRSFPNPHGPNPTKRSAPPHKGTSNVEYVGRLQTGTASVIDPFDDGALAEFTKQVLRNSPYRDGLLDGVETGQGNPVPSRPGEPSPIKHVVYIVKENRTYDQVLGDLGKGNGDPSLTLFDEKISPNHHKLAREFVLFDNFYVNADVSADGHNWSSSAIANDYVQKMWPNSYGGRRKNYDYEGGEPAALPPAGYIWTNAAAAGITMRNYGWWATNRPSPKPGESQIVAVRDQNLAKVTNMNFRAFDLEYPDVDRAKVFIEELKQFEQSGTLPQLMFLRLGNDHTSGAAPGKISPLSAVADNDYALGLVVEAVSKSKFWPETAIFVLEDDAQNGPDHVDSHRSPAYVLSPYTRRGVVDSNLYNTTSMLRTIELILGLRPMTHFDAGARPMSAAFAREPDVRPFEAEPPRISLTERNPAGNREAARSLRLDLEEADRIDDDEMNDILWRTIRGTEPPAPVRSFFGR